jgi:UDP-N-acetylmuramate--alanine ligase
MNGEVREDTLVVVEADEFDRSFLRLFPEIAIVTSADADHLDIYGDHESMIVSFKDFIKQINVSGSLIIHESIAEKLAESVDAIAKITYSMSRGQFFAQNIVAKSGFFEFNLHGFDHVEHIVLGVPGFHNVENAIAASIAAYRAGVSLAIIKKALASFTGVKRRFEFVLRGNKIVLVDDYAHHPTEIEVFLRSLKSMYPRKKLSVIFQPHLYTRTRDFAQGFSESLSLADQLFLLDIYPARELPIPGVDSEMIFKNVSSKMKVLCTKQNVIQKLEENELELVATVGAGDIDTLVDPIKIMLMNRYES